MVVNVGVHKVFKIVAVHGDIRGNTAKLNYQVNRVTFDILV